MSKTGISIPLDVKPDPTRKTSTRGYGSGRVYWRVRVDPHTSKGHIESVGLI